MSTSYYPAKKIKFSDVKKFASDMGLTAHTNIKGCDRNTFALSDGGGNYMWCYRVGRNEISFERYGANSVEDMLNTISNHFEIDMMSEYDIETPEEDGT